MNTSKTKIIVALIATVICLALLAPFFVGAQVLDYQPLAPLPGIGDDNRPVNNLPQYLVSIFRLAIGLAAGLAVIMIMIGGIEYMSTDAIGGKENGKNKIKQALSGLLLAVGAWLILYTVDPSLVTFNLNITSPPPLEGSSMGQSGTSTQYFVDIDGNEVIVDTFGTGYVMKVLYCYTDLSNTSSVLPISLNQVFPYDINYNNDDINHGNYTGYSLNGALSRCQNTEPRPRTFSGGHANCPTEQIVVRHTIACLDTSH